MVEYLRGKREVFRRLSRSAPVRAWTRLDNMRLGIRRLSVITTTSILQAMRSRLPVDLPLVGRPCERQPESEQPCLAPSTHAKVILSECCQ